MSRTRLALVPVLLLSVLSLIGCRDNPSASPSARTLPKREATETAAPSAPTATHGAPSSGASGPSSFALSADELFQQFEKDKKGTRAKYARAILEVSGEVRDVDDGPGDSPQIYLKAGKDIIGLTCLMKENEPWGKATAGQKVKLRGRLPPEPFALALLDCEFSDPEQKPALVLKAEEVAKEFMADPEATQTKYAKKGMVITGEVLKKVVEDGRHTLTLKGTDKISVTCGIGSSASDASKRRFDKLEVGKQAKINGQLEPGPLLVGKSLLCMCLPITE